jgi:uncharacterized membrane protein
VIYQIVYDVSDDLLIPTRQLQIVFLGFALFWTSIWITAYRYDRRKPPDQRRISSGGIFVGIFLVIVGILLVVSETYPEYREQKQCKEWVRIGDYQVAEGPITNLRREAGKYPPWHFQVGEVLFTYRTINPKVGGFHGEFTAPNTEDLELREGLFVRIAYHDERILRIERGYGKRE